MTARQIRRWLRTRRIRHAREQWSADGLYTVVLAAVFLLVTVGAAVRGHLLQAGRPVPVAAVALGSAALLLLAAATAGPLSLGPAALSWIATSPVRRSGLLRPHYAGTLVAGLAAGVPAALVAVPGQSGGLGRTAVVLLALSAGAAAAAATIVVQTSVARPARVLRSAAAFCGLSAVAAGFARDALPAGPPLLLPSTVAAVLLAVVAAVLAFTRLDAVRITALRASSSSVLAFTGGVASGDPGLLSRVAEDRRWERQRLRPRVRLPSGPRALVVQDLATVVRMPSRAVLALSVAALPGLLAERPSSPAVPAAGWLACALFALAQVGGNARCDADRPGLARLLGLTDENLIRWRAVVPVGAALIWSATSTGLLAGLTHRGAGWGVALGLAAAPALAAGALRSSRRSFVRHDYPLIVTPEGVIPSGPLLWTVQSFDLSLIGTLPTLIVIAGGPDPGPAPVVVQVAVSVLTLTGFLSAPAAARGGRRLATRTRWLLSRTVTTIWRA